jgi:hypothetical protein
MQPLRFGPSAAGLLLVIALVLPALAADTSAPKSSAPAKSPPPEASARPLPFRGNLKAVDKAAGRLTIGTRTFEVTAATRFFRSGQPARLEDGVKGEWVTGSYRRQEQQLVAATVYFGGKQPAEPPAKPRQP